MALEFLIKNVSKGLRGKTSNGKNRWFGLMVSAIAISLWNPYRDPNDPNRKQPKKAPMENKYT